MTTITLDKAQQDLPAIVKRVLAGEEILIGTPGSEVKLTPLHTTQLHTADSAQEDRQLGSSYRGRGALKGQLVVGPEFFEPLSDEECGCDSSTG
jgi:antitoxin (DNA-binding transcriptional repressor) of toxin-antitoxin stability system